jgi:formate/nitrite transporter
MVDPFQRMQSDASFALSEGGISTISTQSLVEALSKIPPPKVDINIDCAVPKQMALKYEAAGVKKGKELDFWATFVLAIHAGIFVAMGAGFYTVVSSATTGTQVSYGLMKFAAGLAFCTGLAMVILCGSELFTGNAMIVLAWSSGRVTTYQMAKNWVIVYIGNFLGSLIIAALQLWGKTYQNASYQVGANAMSFAQTKCNREWGQCYCLGILCNIMVCWAVWMTLSAREASSKLMVFILPITAFAAQGFEHCVANMYFLPIGMMVKTYAIPAMWSNLSKNPDIDYPAVAVGQCVIYNFIPATLGNYSGAIFFIGFIYWYLYLRDVDHVSRFEVTLGGVKYLASPPVPPVKKSKKKTAA